eukprot:95166-Chlamydomonas_euryale.AAC.1
MGLAACTRLLVTVASASDDGCLDKGSGKGFCLRDGLARRSFRHADVLPYESCPHEHWRTCKHGVRSP